MALQATHVNSVSPSMEQSPEPTMSRTDSPNIVWILEPEEAGQGVIHKRASSGGDCASSSRRKCHLITGETSSVEEDASSANAEKNAPKSPPPM